KAEPGQPEQLIERRQRDTLGIAEHARAEHEADADHQGHADCMKTQHDRVSPIRLAHPGRELGLLKPDEEFHYAFALLADSTSSGSAPSAIMILSKVPSRLRTMCFSAAIMCSSTPRMITDAVTP